MRSGPTTLIQSNGLETTDRKHEVPKTPESLFEKEHKIRVHTSQEGRKRPSSVLHTKEKEAKEAKDPVALHREDTNNAVVDTLKTCQKACAGTMYDFWHWNNLPGKTPGEKLTTVATRGGRGPYLLLTFAILLLIIFVIVVVARSCSAKKQASTTIIGFKAQDTAPDAEEALRRLAGGTMGATTFETPVAMRPVTTYRQA